ncbi:ATP-dependent DNA helicase Q4 [Strongylocentrotus purpuratus]|uniref:DNA 3'-5' helicase n=1 Tax=Strongylocentrotus purpuratus TaxID=7668 RepID=A0A7M7N5A7_STRPU|nr:ATP-dependent DNA helicase Q4 [Strongylocentrotus purpuratus]
MTSSSDGNEILEIKKALKVWENDFRETNNRKPGRDDIALAPDNVQDLYSKYSKLKKGQKPSSNVTQDDVNTTRCDSSHTPVKKDSTSNDDNGEESKDTLDKSADSTCDDVWGAHLNKSKRKPSEEEEDKVTEKKEDEADAALKMYSKKLFNNSPANSQMSSGPRQGRPSVKKQDFWSKDEKSNPRLDSSHKQGSSIHGHSKDHREPAPVLDFFGTKLSTKTIKFGSCIKGRTNIDPARVVGPGLPKTRHHSLQEDWLMKCEKENELKPYLEDIDMNENSELISDMELMEMTGTSISNNKRSSRKTRRKSVRESADVHEAGNVGESPEKHTVSSQSVHPGSDRDDGYTCIVKKNNGASSFSQHEHTPSKESHKTDEAQFLESVPRRGNNTKKSVNGGDNSSINNEISKDKSFDGISLAELNQIESNVDCIEESDGDKKRLNISPSAPPSKRRKTGSEKEQLIEDGGEKEEQTVVEEEDDGEEDSPKKGKRRRVSGGGGGGGVSSSSSKRSNLNENFVRLNMLTKSYRRKGKGGMRGEAYKRMMWKQKTGAGGAYRGRGGGGFRPGMSQSGDKCFKCGGTGHWASKCSGQGSIKKKCEDESEDPETVMGPLPTLEEAALAAAGAKPQPGNLADEGRGDKFEPLSIATPVYENPIASRSIDPLYEPTEEGIPDATPKAVFSDFKKMGYDTFRPGQEEAVMRILSGLSTLVVLSTGAGKSLCYQLPAYMYNKRSPAITLVISPLVSLMEDQVVGLPHFLKGARLHSHMSKPQREKVHAEIEAGKVQILLVSPEAVVGGGTNCLPHPSKMPPIAFACVDEAHCISEWSHNFRPSYLMLCKVLKERLGVHCILALTATATKTTSDSVAHHLGIADQPGAVIRGCSVPSNLQLSASKDLDRERALIELLKGERFRKLKSIIVYCIRREETERVASLIRTCLQTEPLDSDDDDDDDNDDKGEKMETGEDGQEEKKTSKTKETKKSSYQKKMRGKKNKKPVKLEANSCEAYHAGKSPAERRRVQNQFMSGNLRVVVATVAFGMGLDKADVRSVIHFNLPRTFESFVQEIGRAGRDGLPAHCHIFLDKTGSDVWELKRHTFGNSVDRFTVKKLVKRIFRPCKCNQIHKLKEANAGENDEHKPSHSICPGHACSFPVETTVQDLDIKEEGIATLMCYLELHPDRWLVTHPHTYTKCELNFYGGPRELRECAIKSPAIAAALARERINGKKGSKDTGRTTLEFDVVELASAMGWELTPVKRELRRLQWKHDKIKGWVRTGVMVEFSELAFSFHCRGNLSDEELDGVVDFLHGRVMNLEQRELGQLDAIYSTLESVSKKSWMDCCDEVDIERSDHLRGELIKYFTEELDLSKMKRRQDDASKNAASEEGRIRMTIRQFMSVNHDRTFTGRAVARILQGIASPCYPAMVWGRDRRFWRNHVEADFRTIIKIANEEVMRMR